ncbi:hypothetical protein AA313_de0203478 [Arthrobotrys entomopaga]|nr:hypothetical protein AA313_de0203478 [Arthrobotrys entomopaga]
MPANSSENQSASGGMFASRIVTALIFMAASTKRCFPSFFFTKNHGFLYGPLQGSRVPLATRSLIMVSTSDCRCAAIRIAGTCHALCGTVRMTTGGCTSERKRPISLKSHDNAASLLNSTVWKACVSSGNSFMPTFRLLILSFVNLFPRGMLLNFGINHVAYSVSWYTSFSIRFTRQFRSP